MTREGDAQNEVMCAFGWLPLWRRNVGAGTFRGRQVRFGLKGMADLWGILPGGQHLEVEMKSPTGRQSKDQKKWQQAVEQRGAIYVVARSVEDVWRALDDNGYGHLREGSGRTTGAAAVDAVEERRHEGTLPHRRGAGTE